LLINVVILLFIVITSASERNVSTKTFSTKVARPPLLRTEVSEPRERQKFPPSSDSTFGSNFLKESFFWVTEKKSGEEICGETLFFSHQNVFCFAILVLSTKNGIGRQCKNLIFSRKKRTRREHLL
jgi:hypothetical protein